MTYIPPDEFDKLFAEANKPQTNLVPNTSNTNLPQFNTDYIGLMGANNRSYNSKDLDSFRKYDVNFDNVSNPYKQRQENQTWKEQAFATLYNLPSNVIAGLVEGVGYIGTLAETGDDKDYTNALVEFGKGMRNWGGAGQEVYQNPYDSMDLSDSGYWFNAGGGLVESIASFAALGAGVSSVVGKVAGLTAEGLASVGKGKLAVENAAKLAKYIQTGANLTGRGITAASLAYTEGAMVGSEVYQKVQKEALEEMERETMDGELSVRAKEKGFNSNQDYARHIAAESAAVTVRINTVLNTALNLTSVGAFFPTINAGKTFQRAMNESLGRIEAKLGRTLSEAERTAAVKALINRADENGENIVNKIIRENGVEVKYKRPNGLMEGYNFLSEGTQEFLEEVVNEVAGKAGERAAKDKDVGDETSLTKKYLNAFENLNSKDAFTKEALMSGVLGFVGGAGNTALMRYVGLTSKPQMETYQREVLSQNKDGEIVPTGETTTERREKVGPDGKPVTKRQSNYSREKEEQEFLFNQAKHDLANQFAFIEGQQAKIKKEKEAANPDLIEVARLEDELFAKVALSRAVRNGSAEFLLNTLESIGNTDNTKDIGAEALKEANKQKDELAKEQYNGGYKELEAKQQELKQQAEKEKNVLAQRVIQEADDWANTIKIRQQELADLQVALAQNKGNDKRQAVVKRQIKETQQKLQDAQAQLQALPEKADGMPLAFQYVNRVAEKLAIDSNENIVALEKQAKEFAGKTEAMVKGMTEKADSPKLGFMPSQEYKTKANKFVQAVKKGAERWENLNALYNKGEVGDSEYTAEMWTQMQMADVYEEQANQYGYNGVEFLAFDNKLNQIVKEVEEGGQNKNLLAIATMFANDKKAEEFEVPVDLRTAFKDTKLDEIAKIGKVKEVYTGRDKELADLLNQLTEFSTGTTTPKEQRIQFLKAEAANKRKEETLKRIEELKTDEGKKKFVESKKEAIKKIQEEAEKVKAVQKKQQDEIATAEALKPANKKKEANAPVNTAGGKNVAVGQTDDTTIENAVTTEQPKPTVVAAPKPTAVVTPPKPTTPAKRLITDDDLVNEAAKYPVLSLIRDTGTEYSGYVLSDIIEDKSESIPKELGELLKLANDNLESGAGTDLDVSSFLMEYDRMLENDKSFKPVGKYTEKDKQIVETLNKLKAELGLPVTPTAPAPPAAAPVTGSTDTTGTPPANNTGVDEETEETEEETEIEEEFTNEDTEAKAARDFADDLMRPDVTSLSVVHNADKVAPIETANAQVVAEAEKQTAVTLEEAKTAFEANTAEFKEELKTAIENAVKTDSDTDFSELFTLKLSEINEDLAEEDYATFTELHDNYKNQTKFTYTDDDNKERVISNPDLMASSQIIPIDEIRPEDIEEGDLLVWSFEGRKTNEQYENANNGLISPIGNVYRNKNGDLVAAVAVAERTVKLNKTQTLTYNSLNINLTNPKDGYIVYGIRKKVQGQSTYLQAGENIQVESAKPVAPEGLAQNMLEEYLNEDGDNWANLEEVYKPVNYQLILKPGKYQKDTQDPFYISDFQLQVVASDTTQLKEKVEAIKTLEKIEVDNVFTDKVNKELDKYAAKYEESKKNAADFETAVNNTYTRLFPEGDTTISQDKKIALIKELTTDLIVNLHTTGNSKLTIKDSNTLTGDNYFKVSLFNYTAQEAVDVFDEYANPDNVNGGKSLVQIDSKDGKVSYFAVPVKRINNGLIVLTKNGKFMFVPMNEVKALFVDKAKMLAKYEQKIDQLNKGLLEATESQSQKVSVDYVKSDDNAALAKRQSFDEHIKGLKTEAQADLLTQLNKVNSFIETTLGNVASNYTIDYAGTVNLATFIDHILTTDNNLSFIIRGLRTTKTALKNAAKDKTLTPEDKQELYAQVRVVDGLIKDLMELPAWAKTIGKQRKALNKLKEGDVIRFPKWYVETAGTDKNTEETKVEEAEGKKYRVTRILSGYVVGQPSPLGTWVMVAKETVTKQELKNKDAIKVTSIENNKQLIWVSFTKDSDIMKFTINRDISDTKKVDETIFVGSLSNMSKLLRTHSYTAATQPAVLLQSLRNGDIVRMKKTFEKDGKPMVYYTQAQVLDTFETVDKETGEVFINVATKEYNDTTKATNIITHKFAQNGVSDYKKGQIVRTLLGVFRNQENMKSERNKRNRVIKFLAKVSKPAVKKTRSGKSSVILPTGLHHHQYSMRTFPTAAVGAAYLKLLGPNDVVVYMTATGEKYVRVVQAVNTGVTTYSGETADNTQQVSFITLLNPNDTKANSITLSSNQYQLEDSTRVDAEVFKIVENNSDINLRDETETVNNGYTVLAVFMSKTTQKNNKEDIKRTDAASKIVNKKVAAKPETVIPANLDTTEYLANTTTTKEIEPYIGSNTEAAPEGEPQNHTTDNNVPYIITQSYPNRDINKLSNTGDKYYQYVAAKFMQDVLGDIADQNKLADFANNHKLVVITDEEFDHWYPQYDKPYYIKIKSKEVAMPLIYKLVDNDGNPVLVNNIPILTQLPTSQALKNRGVDKVIVEAVEKIEQAADKSSFELRFNPKYPIKSGQNNWIRTANNLSLSAWEEATKTTLSVEVGSPKRGKDKLRLDYNKIISKGVIYAPYKNKLLTFQKAKLIDIDGGKLLNTALATMLLQLNGIEGTKLLTKYWEKLDTYFYSGIATDSKGKLIHGDDSNTIPVYEVAVIRAPKEHFIYLRGLLNNVDTKIDTENILKGYTEGVDYEIVTRKGGNRFIKVKAKKEGGRYTLSETQLSLMQALLAKKEFSVNKQALQAGGNFKILQTTVNDIAELANKVPTEKQFAEVDTKMSYEQYLKENVLTTNLTTEPVSTLSRDFIVTPVEVATQAPVVDNIDTTTALTEQVKEAVEAGVEIKATTDKKKAVSKTAKGTKAGLNTYQDIVKKYGEDFVKYEMYNITDEDSYENYKTSATSLTSKEADEIFKEDYEAFEEAYGAAVATFKPEYKKIIEEYNNQNAIDNNKKTIEDCNNSGTKVIFNDPPF